MINVYYCGFAPYDREVTTANAGPRVGPSRRRRMRDAAANTAPADSGALTAPQGLDGVVVAAT